MKRVAQGKMTRLRLSITQQEYSIVMPIEFELYELIRLLKELDGFENVTLTPQELLQVVNMYAEECDSEQEVANDPTIKELKKLYGRMVVVSDIGEIIDFNNKVNVEVI